jgi:hypothetical protein
VARSRARCDSVTASRCLMHIAKATSGPKSPGPCPPFFFLLLVAMTALCIGPSRLTRYVVRRSLVFLFVREWATPMRASRMSRSAPSPRVLFHSCRNFGLSHVLSGPFAMGGREWCGVVCILTHSPAICVPRAAQKEVCRQRETRRLSLRTLGVCVGSELGRGRVGVGVGGQFPSVPPLVSSATPTPRACMFWSRKR